MSHWRAFCLRAWFVRWTTEIAVTDRRIIYKEGFIRRSTVEMHMDKVESVDVDQIDPGPPPRLRHVTVNGTGTGTCEPLHDDRCAARTAQPRHRRLTSPASWRRRPRHLGKPSRLPASPAEAVLDRVPNPHPDTNYVARFTVSGIHLDLPGHRPAGFRASVIDYVPDNWLVESKSLKLYLNSFRNHGASTRTARSRSASGS